MFSFLVSGPEIEPVTLDLAKAHLRVETSDDDTLLQAFIVAARDWVEKVTGRGLVTQICGVFEDVDNLRKSDLLLPRAPLQSVVQVSFFSDLDVENVWSASNYFVDTAREPGRIVLRQGAVWPSATRCANGVKIIYKIGYGDAANDVPEPLRLALLQLVAYWYENRGDQASENKAVPSSIFSLIAPYRLMRLGRTC